MRYFNEWLKIDDLRRDFLRYGESDEDFPADKEILFASYEQGGYEGDSVVLYRRKRKLYYNSASHCSCYGLEGQWRPEEVVLKQLAIMRPPRDPHGDKAIKVWENLVSRLCGGEEKP